VLEPGPDIREDEKKEFLQTFDRELVRHPLVVLSGSLPGGLTTSFYGDLVKRAKDAGCVVLLDTSGEALINSLSTAPDLIKPNREEAGTLLGIDVRTIADARDAAHALRRQGPRAVVLSLGAEGAVAVGEDYDLHAIPPAVKAVSTVGSGDAFLAGWAVSTAQGLATDEVLRLAIACGTANCLARSPGMVSSREVERIASQVKIEHLTQS